MEGYRWKLARAGWTVCAAVAWGILLLSVAAEVQRIMYARLPAWLITNLIARTSASLISLSLAGVLYVKRRHEGLVLLTAYFLLVNGVVITPLNFLEPFWPGAQGLTYLVIQAIFFAPLLVAFLSVFPNGRFTPPWTRWLVVAAVLYAPVGTFQFTARAYLRPTAVLILAVLTWFVLIFTGLYAQVYRYRRVSNPVERQQTKWVIFGFSVAMALALLNAVLTVGSNYFSPGASLLPWWAAPIVNLGWALAFAALPVSLTFAVLRYHLFDIDLLINRTLVYGALTASVAGLYVLIVGGAGLVIQTNLTLAALLITAVLVGVIYRPLHTFLQQGVNRLMYGKAGTPLVIPIQYTAEKESQDQDLSSPSPVIAAVHGSGRWLRYIRSLAWFLVAIYFILSATGLYLQVLTNTTPGDTGIPLLPYFIAVIVVGIWPVIGAKIIAHHPYHPVGWLLFVTFPLIAIVMFAIGYASYAASLAPDLLPIPGAILFWLKGPGLPSTIVALTLMYLLFPTGKLLSPRWCPVAWTSIGVLPVIIGLLMIIPGPLSLFPGLDNPDAVSEPVWTVLAPLYLAMIALLALCNLAALASLFVRMRQAEGDEPLQVKWLIIPATVYWIGIPVNYLGNYDPSGFLLNLGVGLHLISVPAIVMAVAFAIFKYRLYDIDLLINRTLVYGALTASVVAIYALLVGTLGVLFQAQGNLIIALIATGLVAVLFQPLRERLQHGVNRLIYGERDDPVEALSRLGRRLEAAVPPDDVLPTLVETIAETLKLPYVAIQLPLEEGNKIAAAYGNPAPEVVHLPLVYQGEDTGQLLVGLRSPGSAFSPAEMRLLRNIARQAGTAVHAVRLTVDLQRSRQQLITAREEERRRLRRDLHDGLGATLAALNLEAAALRRSIRSDPPRAEALVDEFRRDIRATIEDIRRLVYELRPPTLDQLGLVEAVRAQAAQCGRADEQGDLVLQISVDAPEALPPLPAAVEVAAFRIAQEALTNVVSHARAQQCTVRLEMKDGLIIEVVDDGVGVGLVNGRRPNSGLGLLSMRERAEELGGSCLVEPVAGGGTRVLASLPLLEVGERR
jgi:signal transduction histidine kinase